MPSIPSNPTPHKDNIASPADSSQQKAKPNDTSDAKLWLNRFVAITESAEERQLLNTDLEERPAGPGMTLAERSQDNLRALHDQSNAFHPEESDTPISDFNQIDPEQRAIYYREATELMTRFYEEALSHTNDSKVTDFKADVDKLLVNFQTMGLSEQDCISIQQETFTQALQNHRNIIGDTEFENKMQNLSTAEINTLHRLFQEN